MAVLAFLLLGSFWPEMPPPDDALSLSGAVLMVRAYGPGIGARSFESFVRGSSKSAVLGVEHWFRRTVKFVGRLAGTWLHWLRRALLFAAMAALLLLAESRLLALWRREGLRPLGTYVPLILYVYACLLLDRRTAGLGKLVLALSMVYGVVQMDLVPDGAVLPGLVDDVLVMALGVTMFRKSCSQAAVDDWARKAVRWRERTITLQASKPSHDLGEGPG
jgi:uncharacterized membrane protein YkvA (DUF1232 family)